MTRPYPAAFLLLALGLVTACAPRPASDARPGSDPAPKQTSPKRLLAAIQSDPIVLSSKIRLLGVGIAGISELERLVTAGATVQDDRGILHPQLAEAVPTIASGLWRLQPDGRMETTWKIRSSARWHDGTPVSADDLIFTTRVVQDREIAAFREAAYDFIEAVESPDPQTITVRWREPFIEADGMFSGDRALPFPKHLLERTYLEDKASFTQAAYWSDEFVGAGPYRVQLWSRGSHVMLEANEAYVLGRPRIDQIEVRFIADPNTLGANILAGAVELTVGRSLSLDQAIQVRDRWATGSMELGDISSVIVIYPQFINPSPAVVGEVAFRRALMHAIDRQEMVESLQAGLAPVAHAFLTPMDSEFEGVQRSIARYPFDTSRALQLIQGLGYSRGSDAFFRDASGQRLTVEIRTSQGDDLQEKSLFAAAAYWQRAGVAVDQVLVTPQQAEGREYRATFPGFDVKRQPGDRRFLLRAHGSKAPLPENNFVGNNYARYRNAEFDALIDRYFVTIPQDQRSQILGQIVHQMTDQVVILTLFFQTSPIMVANRLIGLTGPAQGWNVHEWDVPA